MRRFGRSLAVVAVVGLIAAGCGGGNKESGGGSGGQLTKVTLQLKWVTQAQFAGYYAALDQGYYQDEGLDVTILPGGPDITPEQVVAGGAADIGINWTSSTLVQRDQGMDLVTIAQVFTRSGVTEIAWAPTPGSRPSPTWRAGRWGSGAAGTSISSSRP